MPLSRRNFFAGLAVTLATPAIVRASSLDFIPSVPKLLRPEVIVTQCPVDAWIAETEFFTWANYEERLRRQTTTELIQITRETIRRFQQSNEFIQHIQREWERDRAFAQSGAANGFQWGNEFAQPGAKIGATLRIRLPNDFTVVDQLHEPS